MVLSNRYPNQHPKRSLPLSQTLSLFQIATLFSLERAIFTPYAEYASACDCGIDLRAQS